VAIKSAVVFLEVVRLFRTDDADLRTFLVPRNGRHKQPQEWHRRVWWEDL